MLSVTLVEAFVSPESVAKGSLSWSELSSRYTTAPVSNDKKALLVDDLEAFELTASNANSARKFFAGCLRSMYEQVW